MKKNKVNSQNGKIKKFLKECRPAWGTGIVFIFAFISGLIQNLSISYMGNSSEYVEQMLFDLFLGPIVLLMLKVIAVYLILALFFGFTIHLFWKSWFELRERSLSFKKAFFLNFVTFVVLYLLNFFSDAIRYPQVYMNNFYAKSSFNRHWLNWNTENINPLFLEIVLGLLIAAGIFVIIRAIYQRKEFSKKKKIFMGVAFSSFLIVIVLANFNYHQPNENVKQPNVLILASDAMRPDHLSANGYFQKTSPNLDQIIKKSVQFTNTYIEVPRTFPSWTTMMTGNSSLNHGVRHMFPQKETIENMKLPTMATAFNEHGYYTAVVGDYAADVFSRINFDFQKIETPFFNLNYMVEQSVVEEHLILQPLLTSKLGCLLFPSIQDSAYYCPPSIVKNKIIKQIKAAEEKPFFITAFFSATHFPYAPPYPYYKKFSQADYHGDFKYYKQRVISLDQDVQQVLTKEDIQQTNALYDGGILAFDKACGGVIEYLKDKKMLENTIIVILADHGENLYEGDNGMGHGEHLRGHYALKVPFIIYGKNVTKKYQEVNHLVRQIDIAPTILDCAQIKPLKTMQGISRKPEIFGKPDPQLLAYGETGIWFDNSLRDNLFFQQKRIMYPNITMLSDLDLQWQNQIVLNPKYQNLIEIAKHRYVFDGRYKLIYMPTRTGIEYELYDLLLDPEETKNIVDDDAYNFQRLKKELFKIVTQNKKRQIVQGYILPLEE